VRGLRRAALKQSEAKPAFEVAHPHADGWLGHAVTAGCPAQAAEFGDGIQ